MNASTGGRPPVLVRLRRFLPSFLRALLSTGLAASALAIVHFLFVDGDSNFVSPNLVPIVQLVASLRAGREDAWRQTIGNVLLFVPVGFFTGMLWHRSPRRTLGWLVLLVPLVEPMQALLADGRVFDVDDILLNVTGAAVGWAIAWLLRPST